MPFVGELHHCICKGHFGFHNDCHEFCPEHHNWYMTKGKSCKWCREVNNKKYLEEKAIIAARLRDEQEAELKAWNATFPARKGDKISPETEKMRKEIEQEMKRKEKLRELEQNELRKEKKNKLQKDKKKMNKTQLKEIKTAKKEEKNRSKLAKTAAKLPGLRRLI